LKIQVNSDKTIAVDTSLIDFVQTETARSLDRFAAGLTRVEVHLSDIDGARRGQADKRCLIEARPRAAKPLTANAAAPKLDAAVRSALAKLRHALTTFFERSGRTIKAAPSKSAAPASAPASQPAAKKSPAGKVPAKRASKKTAAKKSDSQPAPAAKPPKKKGIYQARRKSWPAR
jgi:hypothetical protein